MSTSRRTLLIVAPIHLPHGIRGLAVARSAHDANALTLLAVASKASWAYDTAFMHAAEPALRATAEYLENNPVHILEQAVTAVGFFGFIASEEPAELNDFWVHPRFPSVPARSGFWTAYARVGSAP